MYMLIQYAVLKYWPTFNHIQAYTCFQFSDYLIELSTCTTQWIQDYVSLILFQKYDKSFDVAHNYLIIWSDGVQHSGSKVMCLWYCILIWHTNHLIWHTTAESRTIHNLFEFRPQTGEQLINSIKSTCYILMTMMIYCNQWPLLLLNLYWHLAFKYFQLWQILMNTWQVTILILSCISPQSNQSSSSINKLKHFWQMNIMKIHFSTDWNIWKLVLFSNIHTNA